MVGYLPADKSDFKSDFTDLDAALWHIKFDVEALGVISHAQRVRVNIIHSLLFLKSHLHASTALRF